MRIMSLVILLLYLLSCKKDNPKNCGCDRIVDIFQYNVVPGYEDINQSMWHFADVKTVNECSGWNKTFKYQSRISEYSKKVGECY